MRKSIVTVLGPTAPVYDLTTVDAVNAALGISGNTKIDGITAGQITTASKMIAEYCATTFAMLDVLESFRRGFYTMLPYYHPHWGGPGYALKLSQFPISAFTSLTLGGALLDSTTYEIDNDKGLLYTTGFWSGDLVAVYSGGYSLPDDAPALLSQACILMVAALRRLAMSARHDPYIREIQHTDTRVMYFDAAVTGKASGLIPQNVLDLIAPYQQVFV